MSGAVPEHSPVVMGSSDSLLAGSVEESHLLRKLFNVALLLIDFFIRHTSEFVSFQQLLVIGYFLGSSL